MKNRIELKTDADWKRVEEELMSNGRVKLIIDKHNVDLYLIGQGLRRYIAPVVDGDTKFDWIMKDCELRRRFARPSEKYNYNKKSRDLVKRRRMTKWYKEYRGIDINEKIIQYTPEWSSFSSLRKHLAENNRCIEHCPDSPINLVEYMRRLSKKVKGE